MTNTGGPFISLKATSKKNQITVCWQSIDTKKLQIEKYYVLINGERKETVENPFFIEKILT